jgi:membrane associated rhomboid family serine protease
VVATLIAINVAVYLISTSQPSVVTRYEQAGVLVASGQYERLLTATFLHAGILHLLFNMAALLIIGPPLENALGRVRFVGLYLLAGLGGSALSYLYSDPRIPSVGASGAIFGLFGAYFIIARSRRADTGGIVALIVINLVFSFAQASLIDWKAHVGGLVMGTALASAFAFAETRPTPQRWLIEGAACLAAVVLIVGVVQVRTDQIRMLA